MNLTEVFIRLEEVWLRSLVGDAYFFPAMLEAMVSCGHSWQAVSFVPLGASVRGSSAYTESGGASLGNATTKNSPGQMIVAVGGERSTMARSAAELIGTACWDPQLWIVPSPRITWRWTYCDIIGFHEGVHQDFDDKAFEGKSMAFTDKMEACLTDNVQGR